VSRSTPPPPAARSIVRLRSWSELARRLDPLPGGVAVLSVDVFDTLLLRRIDADAVTRAVELELTRRLRLLGCEPVRDPGRARFAAFTLAAERNAARGTDFCASLREALPLWVAGVAGDRFRPPDGFLDGIEDFEWRSERDIVAPNRTLLEWLRRIRPGVERLVFTSDMALSTKRIRMLLEHVGFRGLFDAGYVSSDQGVLKNTSRLFRRVADAEGAAPAAILHIGDDHEGDGERATEQGCRAYVVGDRRRARELAAQSADRITITVDRRWGGPVAASAAAAAAPAVRTRDEDVAWRSLGAPVCTFALRVSERCRDLAVRRVYFLSREGHCLKGVYDRVNRLVWPDGDGPPSSYLCVSRLSTLLAGARSYDLRVLEAAVRNHRRPTVRTLLGPFGFPDDLVLERSRRYGIDDLDAPLPHDPWWWTPVQRLLADRVLSDRIAEGQRVAESLLEDYLAAEGFFGAGRVAFVDIGWTGQIQDHLVHAVDHRPDTPQVVGLYLGVRRSVGARDTARSTFEGLVADERVAAWGQQAAFRFPQGLEELLRAPHGTVVGYARDSAGRVAPRLRDADSPGRRREASDEARTAPLQQALLDYATAWSGPCGIFGLRGVDLLPYARACIDRLLRMPTPDERRLLTGLANVCDLGMEVVVPLGGDDPEGPERRSPRSLPSRLRESFWRHGTVHSALGPIAALPFVAALEVAAAPAREVEMLATELHHGCDPPAAAADDTTAPSVSPGAEIETEATARREALCRAARDAETRTRPSPRPPGLKAAAVAALLRVVASVGCRITGSHPYRCDLVPLRLWIRALARRRWSW